MVFESYCDTCRRFDDVETIELAMPIHTTIMGFKPLYIVRNPIEALLGFEAWRKLGPRLQEECNVFPFRR
jgi:hypothetical protein